MEHSSFGARSTMPWLTLRCLGLASILIVTIVLGACSRQPDLPDGLYAIMATSRGQLILRLEYQKAPLTVMNFVGLAEGSLGGPDGRPFYDGLSFHRVVPGFVVQGGDPLGDGSGGPGYEFPDEIHPDLLHDAPGVVAMANYGPHTNGSQFYITYRSQPSLDGRYSVFGKVIRGMEAVEAMQVGDTIRSVRIVRNGAAAQAFRTDQEAWVEALRAARDRATQAKLAEREAMVAAILGRWPGLEPSTLGMYRQEIQPGQGEPARRGNLVRLKYTAYLPNGLIYESTAALGGDVELELGIGAMLLGLDRAVEGMREGGRLIVAIPPELAYGIQGADGIVPPSSYVVFDLEVTGIE